MDQAIEFRHRHKTFQVRIGEDGSLELWLDGCLRKRREPGVREPRYVWTNVELEWEEHHYVEVRLWPSERRLRVDVNREPILERRVPAR